MWQGTNAQSFYFQIVRSDGTLALASESLITTNDNIDSNSCNVQITALANNAMMFSFIQNSYIPQSVIFNGEGIQQGDFFTLNETAIG